MHTIKLKISDKVYDKLIWLLSKFNKDEVEIVSDVDTYAETQKYLKKELDEIFNGEATFHTLEEFDKKLDDSIRANETKI
ncbi:MAG: tRNA pseudouridine synthase A [Bacteroidales bacterium]|nr:tRNA pseudouridine synthase A [Bacteroidales bacterium]